MVCRPIIVAAFWHTIQPKNGFLLLIPRTIRCTLFSSKQSSRSLFHILQGDAMPFALHVHRICDASRLGRMLQNWNGQQCDLHSRPSHERYSKRFNEAVARANCTPSLLSRLTLFLFSEYHRLHFLPCIHRSSYLTHLSAIRQYFAPCSLSRILHFSVCVLDIIPVLKFYLVTTA